MADRKLSRVPKYRPEQITFLCDVREQLATLYRDARTGRIDPGDAAKLPYVLQVLARVIESESFEQRLAALEAKVASE